MSAAVLLALAAAQAPPPEPLRAVTPRVVRVRSVYREDRVAMVLVERRTGGRLVRLGSRAAEIPWSAERFPAPVGDGVWAVLLDGRLRPLGAYPAAVPEGEGQRCEVEVPIRRGVWWLLLLRREGGRTEVLAQLEVGPDLVRLARSGEQQGDVAHVGPGGARDQDVASGGQGGP